MRLELEARRPAPFRRLIRSLATAALASAALLVAAPAAWASCPDESSPASALTDAQIEASIVCLVNEQRASAGRRPLRMNARLREAALRHSTEMVSLGYFEHVSPTGVRFVDRILETGYGKAALDLIVGENLAEGSGAASSPAAIVISWVNSPVHRANMLRKRFREIGIGVVRGTTMNAGDAAGVTVSSEYGSRKRAKSRNRKPR